MIHTNLKNCIKMKRLLSRAGSALRGGHVLASAWALTTAALLVACGGGNDVGNGGTFSLPTDDLLGAPCASCAPGVLVGLAATGSPLAHAQVRVVASNGTVVRGRTMADGSFRIVANGLAGAMLVQVSGLSSGAPVLLHSLALAADIGNRAVGVTPLTELMTAFALGGYPQDLLQSRQIDFSRVSATSLRSQEARVRFMVNPVLEITNAAQSDLRTGAFATDRTGLDAAFELIELTRVSGGYALRSVLGTQSAILLDPAASSAVETLPAMTTAERDTSRSALSALNAIALQLNQLTAQFASAIPAAEALRPLFAAGFYHTGLDAQGFVDQVLRRQDSAETGAYSLRSASFHTPRAIRTDGPDRLLVRFQVSPAGPWPAYAEEMWMNRGTSGWLWQGDGKKAQVNVRNVAVLGAQALTESAVRAQAGMQCVSHNGIERCRIDGPTAAVPAGGYLDYGAPQDAQFGMFAFYRARTGSPLDRLVASRNHSRIVGLPSARVTNHLAFEIDSRRIDPAIRKVRVTGLGLPAQGLIFVAPVRLPGSPEFSHWTHEDRPDHNWHALQIGRCVSFPDAPSESCSAQWAQLGAGQTYQFELLDQSSTVLQTLTARLFDKQRPEPELLSLKDSVFARFNIATQTSAQPSYPSLLDPDRLASGGTLSYAWLWRPPADDRMRVLASPVELRIAEFATGAISMRETQLLPVAGSLRETGSTWISTFATSAGTIPVWLAARLVAADELGNLYVHHLSPANPY